MPVYNMIVVLRNTVFLWVYVHN